MFDAEADVTRQDDQTDGETALGSPHVNAARQCEPSSGRRWSDAQVRALVSAYFELARRSKAGDRERSFDLFPKQSVPGSDFAATFKVNLRAISFVLSLMGRRWIDDLPPTACVDAEVVAQIERAISEFEGRYAGTFASEQAQVARLRMTSGPMPPGSVKPPAFTASASVFVRDPMVKAWVLERAKGVCEACAQPAPFVDAHGFPYLELHHLRRLADGGSNTPSNAVAVCPNCHRRLHFSKDAREVRDALYRRVGELIREQSPT